MLPQRSRAKGGCLRTVSQLLIGPTKLAQLPKPCSKFGVWLASSPWPMTDSTLATKKDAQADKQAQWTSVRKRAVSTRVVLTKVSPRGKRRTEHLRPAVPGVVRWHPRAFHSRSLDAAPDHPVRRTSPVGRPTRWKGRPSPAI